MDIMHDYSNKKFPVEYLIFNVKDPKFIDKFIDLDHKIWTKYLSSQPGFISKEVWINDNKPGEIHTILIWENLKCWKAICIEELKLKDKEFTEKFGEEFAIVRRIHKETEHGLHKVRHFELEKGL